MKMIKMTGSAYTMVVIVGMVIFMMLSGAMAVSRYGRRVTGHYSNFAGLYDLALSGNERAFFLLRDELTLQHSQIEARVTEIALADIENRLTYRNGEFFVSDAYLLRLYKAQAESLLMVNLNESWTKKAQVYELPWTASVKFTDVDGAAVDIFSAVTKILPHSNGYTIDTVVHVNQKHPAKVEAEIRWPTVINVEAKYIPVRYAWRSVVPEHFTEPISEWAADVLTDATMLERLRRYNESALLITDEPALTFTHSDAVLLIHTGTSVVIDGNFNGLIISYGDVLLENAQISGSVWASGTISASAATVVPDSDLLFDMKFSQAAVQDVYDYLKLTQFSKAASPTGNIASVLDKLCFAQGELLLNDFNGYMPSMVKSKRIAD